MDLWILQGFVSCYTLGQLSGFSTKYMASWTKKYLYVIKYLSEVERICVVSCREENIERTCESLEAPVWEKHKWE